MSSAEPEATTPPAPDGRPFGRYVLLEELGHGGMGVVWKAWDTELRRVVALKGLLRLGAADDVRVERLLREARSAARLHHPHIVPVHDVGVHEGDHYFTSEYIAARPLDRLVKEGPVAVRQAVSWLRDVAEALAYAHGQGVVHRDVKPANILIDGDGHAYVTDFGIAAEVEGDHDLTASGELLGTPTYMSPEQASGRARSSTPSTDQFSLGATLYHLVAGRPPFEAGDLRGLLNAIAERDPLPPTALNPHLHRDVETICLKALEKDPSRRYTEMRDLAEDLGRWLEGEPIAARPVSTLSRIARKAARRWRVTVPVAAVVALAVALVVRSRSAELREDTLTKARAEAEEALRKSQRVLKVVRDAADLAGPLARLEARRHDSRLSIEERRRRAEEDWGPIRRFMERTAPDATSQAAMWAFAGWAKTLAGDPEEGDAWMRKGSELDPDVPYGALFRALALLSPYLEGQPLPLRSYGFENGRMEGLPPETEEMRRARERMQALLEEASRAMVWGEDEVADCREALRGMRALQAGRYAEAADALTRAMESPSLGCVRISLRLARSSARSMSDDTAGAISDFEELVASCPTQPLSRFRLASERIRAAQILWDSGQDPRDGYRAAIAELDEALALDPGNFDAIEARGVALLCLGEVEDARGEDPREALKRSLEDLDAAVRLMPDAPEVRNSRANALVRRACVDYARGVDSRKELEAALRDYGVAISAGGREAYLYENRADAHIRLATIEAARGRDPFASGEAAGADLDVALGIDPRSARAWELRGDVHLILGEARDRRGLDAREECRAAIEAADRALALDPRCRHARVIRAQVHCCIGDTLAERGEDPLAEYDAAISDLAAILKEDPGYLLALIGRCRANVERAIAQARRGEDPSAAFQNALADAEAAIAAAPENADAWRARAGAYLEMAQERANRRAESDEPLQLAIADLDAALVRNPSLAIALNDRGIARRALGESALRDGEDPLLDYRRAIEDFDSALRVDPSCVIAYNNRGNVHRSIGEVERRTGSDPRESYRRSIGDFSRVLERLPACAEAYGNRAGTLVHLGEAESALGLNPAASYEAALEDFARALRTNSGLWPLRVNRGQLFLLLGRRNDAIADFEEALRLCPGLPIAQECLARARASLPAWATEIDRGTEAIQAGDYTSARSLYEGAIAAAAEADPREDALLARVRVAEYHLACILALSSSGRDSPSAEPRSIGADEAARLTEAAFRHLRRAVERGWKDADAMGNEPDLSPLRDDPRWAEVLRSLGD